MLLKNGIIKILVLLAGLVFLGVGAYTYWPDFQNQPADDQSQPVDAKEPIAIDSAQLQSTYQAAQLQESSPEEEEDEQAFDAEQIEEAKQLLLDLDAKQRMEGLEQLSAYPNVEAEKLMVDALKKDTSEDVRAAAAENLSYIEQPSLETQNALISAMQDSNEDVRNNALSTLESYLMSLEDDDASAKRIVSLLQKEANSKQIPEDMRTAINEFLAEQLEE